MSRITFITVKALFICPRILHSDLSTGVCDLETSEGIKMRTSAHVGCHDLEITAEN